MEFIGKFNRQNCEIIKSEFQSSPRGFKLTPPLRVSVSDSVKIPGRQGNSAIPGLRKCMKIPKYYLFEYLKIKMAIDGFYCKEF